MIPTRQPDAPSCEPLISDKQAADILTLHVSKQQLSGLQNAADTNVASFYELARTMFDDDICQRIENLNEFIVIDRLPSVHIERGVPLASDSKRLSAYKNEWILNRRREWLQANGPCECGSWENLEVHHINPAEKTTHRIWSWSEERRNSELAKCKPLCRECHKKETKANYVVHGKITRYRKGCRCELCVSEYEAFKLSRRNPQ